MTLPTVIDPNNMLIDPSTLMMDVPFKHEVQLMRTYVAGTDFVPNIRELVVDVKEGCRLKLLREPQNPYDSNAIAVMNSDDKRIGYIPKRANESIAALMDAGKDLYCGVVSTYISSYGVDVEIKVMMNDL